MGFQWTKVALQRIANNMMLEGDDPNNAGLLFGTQAILFVNDAVITVNTVYGDLTQPSWGGYAAAAVTWSGPYQDLGFAAIITGSLMTFSPNADPASSVTVYGWGLIDPGTPNVLLGAEIFPVPQGVTSNESVVRFVPQLKIPPAQVYSGAVVI